MVRRMPFAVRSEVAKQLREMQAAGVVQPSSSPWVSLVVMVRKRDEPVDSVSITGSSTQ